MGCQDGSGKSERPSEGESCQSRQGQEQGCIRPGCQCRAHKRATDGKGRPTDEGKAGCKGSIEGGRSKRCGQEIDSRRRTHYRSYSLFIPSYYLKVPVTAGPSRL